MSVSVKLILTLVIGYLLGSISTGVIVSRVFGHKDIRSEGSGNSGTTNMLRVMGKKYALLTFAGDLLKGIVAVLIGKAWLGTQAGEIVGKLLQKGFVAGTAAGNVLRLLPPLILTADDVDDALATLRSVLEKCV